MKKVISRNPLQQKSILPTSKFKSPFSELTLLALASVAKLESKIMTQNI